VSKSVDWFKVRKAALTDWRIALLAEELGGSFGDAFHLCSTVWCRLYERGGGFMPATEVDGVARRKGLAEAMVKVGLADATPDGLRIHGDELAMQWAQFRISQKQKSIAGNEARWGNADDNKVPVGIPPGVPGASPGILISSSLSGSGSSPESGRAAAQARQAEKREQARVATEAWLEWFNRSFARSFRVTQALTKQVGAILAQGHTEKPDMRGVALYLGMRWEDKPEMAAFLVPPSILRPSKFEERLELAREWDRTINGRKIWGSP